MNVRKEWRLASFIVVLAGLLSIACGGNGGDSDLLRLDGGNVGREDYHRYLRQQFLESPTSTAACARLRGLSAEEILDTIGETPGNEEVEFDPLPDGWEPVAGQVADEEDLLATATIFKEECERIDE